MQEGKLSVNGFLKRFGKRMRRLQWMISAVWRIIAQSTEWEESFFVVCLPALQLFLFGWLHLVLSTEHGDSNAEKKIHCNWWCAFCGCQYEWRTPNMILMIQFGVNAHEAKVIKVHTAPLELCDILINALNLLANQQKDGDSPIQSIVTGLHERSRRGIMDGLRRFQADSHSAVDVV